MSFAPLPLVLAFVAVAPAMASDQTVDCAKKSLAAVLADTRSADSTVRFTGLCTGPLAIGVDGLALEGFGTAIINGAGADALTVTGATRVSLSGFEVRNGLGGIVASNGAHLSLSGISVHDNAGAGVALRLGSTAALGDVTTGSNAADGLVSDNGSSAVLTGAVVASGNAGNGITLSAGSTLAMGGTSTLQANGNGRAGLQVDDGASLRVAGAAFVGNGLKDLLLTFGARADFRTTSFGTYSCDATVLVRGTLGLVCPH